MIHPDDARLLAKAQIGCGAILLSAVIVLGALGWALLKGFSGMEGLG